MNMKKKVAPLLVAALVAANAVPVLAVENYQDVSETRQSGNTTVVANVMNIDSGNVTYTISVPSYVDFGSLQRNEENMQAAYDKDITGQVTLTQVAGMDNGKQRIAVLVKDAENGTEGFKINGTSGAARSNNKSLNYKIMAGEQELDNTTVYPNGFLVGAFQQAGDTVNLTFKLDQNQMTGELDQWEGNYQGTLTFYSKVAGLNDYN